VAEVSELRQSRPELSLRRFARYAGVPYWQLRDFEKRAPARHQRSREPETLCEQVKQVALLHPTYGYRFLYQELRAQGNPVGLHRVRGLLGELGLNPPQPRKTRRPSVEVAAPPDWPTGRRVQIDATRLSLADGVCWVYHVLDVESRVVLASKAVRSLSMQLAKAALDEGIMVLRSLGIHGSVLVQSDGGSDFTGEVFQQAYLKHGPGSDARFFKRAVWGCWKGLTAPKDTPLHSGTTGTRSPRCRPPYPYFHRWYNRERRHSVLNYCTPWSTLTERHTLA
jgi:transposase InsO family protein